MKNHYDTKLDGIVFGWDTTILVTIIGSRKTKTTFIETI